MAKCSDAKCKCRSINERGYKNANSEYSFTSSQLDTTALFTEITNDVILIILKKNGIILISMFKNYCRTSFSSMGPGLAAGDIDGNGLDDIVCGGSSF
jgi:hypothetical protein